MDPIDFYDTDPEGYSEETFTADVSELRDRFLAHLPAGARILDLGCGSGRDTVAFRSMGFTVVPVDGSEGMCRVAVTNTGSPVRRLLFSDLDYDSEFDGVWACSSLLHVPSVELPRIMSLVHRALRPDGILYVSFKEGVYEGVRDGRYYTDATVGSLTDLVPSDLFSPVDVWTSREPGRGVTWVNGILRREGKR
ncbi:MAG: class I SAM-dependent methyltransferase [Candidatus Methanomethylophilaceae archaeon]|nr:class I SAM-dependent methyltransferase [Candidatus Methanomethylophilaceae archaeon]